ncbi:MAG: hypothetical protein ACRDU4_00115 [Mycobacterium sp.]
MKIAAIFDLPIEAVFSLTPFRPLSEPGLRQQGQPMKTSAIMRKQRALVLALDLAVVLPTLVAAVRHDV